jgi:single-stranded DNA-binding protein
MLDALIAGRLYGAPASRTTKARRPFATAKVRVSLRDGGTAFVNVIAFAESAVTALLALADGDSVAFAGELTASAYLDKEGVAKPSLDLLAHSVLSAFHVQRRRKAVTESPLPFDDELPGAA